MEHPPPWAPPGEWPLPIRTARTIVDAYRDSDSQILFRTIEQNREALLEWLP